MLVKVFPIGIVGLGDRGLPMAQALAGVRLVLAYDESPAARERASAQGVPVAGSLADLAQVCRTVVLALPGDAVERVVLEIATKSPGRLVLDTSAQDADDTRRIGALALAQGTTYLDTPVAGDVREVGDWTVRMGGPAAAYVVVADVFAPVASEVVHVGELGSASQR